MAYVTKLFNHNFLEYASYVIKDRAIPHIDDGLKPVHRRIIHSLLEVDDGKFHKVANIVGHCMKYHPHGDASIYSALVVLANKDFFIEKQGNFGNIFTGDEASAARYIECRITPLAKKVLYNPELTEYIDSYDGRNREPVTYPAKIPILLIQGAEGIAVGMSTKVLPHNFHEVLSAVSAALREEKFALYPDFPTRGLIDVSEYNDGNGKVLIRAKLDTSDPKRIVIREIPYGTTTESLIRSIEYAAKRGKIKVASITDYTTDNVEIEIRLPRNVYGQDVIDGLYAFTDCEIAVSVNLLVIKDNKPTQLSVSELIQYSAAQLKTILKKELRLEDKHLADKLHARTLEQIFIEERIYKRIEQMRTQETVIQAVIDGFQPFLEQIEREVTREDVERLLRIPIRRISLYDIEKAKKEMIEIRKRREEIAYQLNHITEYAIGFLEQIGESYCNNFQRTTEIMNFEKVDIREAAEKDRDLRYDSSSGYLGHAISEGKILFRVSPYDRILLILDSGIYQVINVPEKLYIEHKVLHCSLAEKEELSQKVFSIVYKDKKTGNPYLKRCTIEQFILEKEYSIIPEETDMVTLTTRRNVAAWVKYKKRPRIKKLEDQFQVKNYLVKSVRASGVKLSDKELKSARFSTVKD